ncbi:MAG: hypothetical protein ABI743_10965, partial [bacterium]
LMGRTSTIRIAWTLAVLLGCVTPLWAQTDPPQTPVEEPPATEPAADEAPATEETVAEEESVEEEGPSPSDIPYWMQEAVTSGILIGGYTWQDTRGGQRFGQETGEPPMGLTLHRFQLDHYLGDGQLVSLDLREPWESDQYGAFRFRHYGLGDFRGRWYTTEYFSFPEATESRWTGSDMQFRFTGSDNLNFVAKRQHYDHHGIREIGPIDGETERIDVSVPLRTDSGDWQGALTGSRTKYDDSSARFHDSTTNRLGATVQHDFGQGRTAALAYQQVNASLEGSEHSSEVRHYAIAWQDADLGGDQDWSWDIRGDWEDADKSIVRNWLPDGDWTVATRLTWHATPWRISGGYSTGQHDRMRIDIKGIKDLKRHPDDLALETGMYIPVSIDETVWDLAARYQPARDWMINATVRSTNRDGLPITAVGDDDDPETPGDITPLWFADELRFTGSARYTVAPLQQVIFSAFKIERSLDERDSSSNYSRWDVTWQDASHELSWYAKAGYYANGARVARVDNFTNHAWLYGLGGSYPLTEKLDASADLTVARAADHDSYNEYTGSVALEYQVDEAWSMEASMALQALDLGDANDVGDLVTSRYGLFATWKY